MFCPNCGSQMPDGVRFCPRCGAQLGAQTVAPVAQAGQIPPANFKDYKGINIALLIVSILCCGSIPSLITTIIGVVTSSQARSAYDAGNYAVAGSKAKTAKAMMIVSIVLIILAAITAVVVAVLYGAALIPALLDELI